MFAAGPYDMVHAPGLGQRPPAPRPDLHEAVLYNQAAALLGVQYLGDAADGFGAWPAHGIVFGPFKRNLLSLPTQLGSTGPVKNVIFLVDPDEPTTQLSAAAFASLLGTARVPPAAAHARINGCPCQVRLRSPACSRPDVSVLGSDFMSSVGVQLLVDYKEQTVTLQRAA